MCVLALCAAALGAAAKTDVYYTLKSPTAPVLNDTSNVAHNVWLAANPTLTATALFAPMTNSLAIDKRDGTAGLDFHTITSAAAGFPVQRVQPEYYLGETIAEPENVDWVATYAAFQADAANLGLKDGFLFDPVGKRVFAIHGGTQLMQWVYKDGSTNTLPCVVAGNVRGRPYRIFWTDEPYDAPQIDLSGKFVKFWGNPALTDLTYGTITNEVGGQKQIVEDSVVKGLYLDSSTHMLSVHGKLSGQVVMAYYDSGHFDTIKHVQVIEVGPPDVTTLNATIGTAIVPAGGGHSVDGLTALPQNITATDNRGDYCYQHQGTYSYSPKHGQVFPLRPTKDEPWKLSVYWIEYDSFGTGWHFEYDYYAADWGDNAMYFVRGEDPANPGRAISIPDGYTAVLQMYQEPEGHAQAVSENRFITTGAGYSLLKLTSTDNVWFMPVRSVLRTDTTLFDLEPAAWNVGTECTLRGGSAAGHVSEDVLSRIDTSVAGYLFPPASGDEYNPNLYRDDSTSSTYVQNGKDAEGNTVYPSAVYPVSASKTKPLEVWWCSQYLGDGMTNGVTVPSLPQTYWATWPGVYEVSDIVLASQKGSALEGFVLSSASLYFDATNAMVEVPSRYAFSAGGGTVSFWANADYLAERAADDPLAGQVFELGGMSEMTLRARVWRGQDGVTHWIFSCLTNAAAIAELTYDDESSGSFPLHLAWSFTPTNTTLYVFGIPFDSCAYPIDQAPNLDAWLTGNALGASAYANAAEGVMIDDFAIRSTPFETLDFVQDVISGLDPNDGVLTCLYTFDGTDLAPTASGVRTATEGVYRHTCTAKNVLKANEGAPRLASGVIDADDDDVAPFVYTQNDPTKIGYNPNEEHAFVTKGEGGYIAWALRCDLNTADTSEPGVLVEYVKDGCKKMRYFRVLATNELYTAFADTCTVGTVLPGPHPLDLLDSPWLTENWWEAVPNQAVVAFEDRKHQIWSRTAGKLPIHMYYPMQEGFYFPSLDVQPDVGTPVPWLSTLGNTPGTDVLSRDPITWTWTAQWPQNVNRMYIGQTLMEAKNGLPGVWNMKSLAVAWPDAATDLNRTVMLYDPTVIQHAGSSTYATPVKLAEHFNFSTDGKNKTRLKNGKYYFNDLPPSISERFYINSNLAASNCICLEGKYDTSEDTPVLYVNVLTKAERTALENVITEKEDATLHKEWAALIANLATAPVLPSAGAWNTRAGAPAPRLEFNYTPADHYALTAMGGAGYVTLVENDATNTATGVTSGDVVSMHVFQITNAYYTGSVVAREDPMNLLSQQLDILYTESFGGKADEFEFEWKFARPNANGTQPTDYENAFTRKFAAADSAGLTRFTLGGDGNTLADLVNTYYVMRYRAKDKNSPAYATMGDTWSDWCGPTLAEGWLQRVLNNVTPFTQRMQDLYDNAAETDVTMLKAAGAPYDGDVALNQDALTSYGLIQLYQTILNKAESMSLTLGINDTDANKQLLLAVERLADLYMVLGNEAYADALNPTIGFGSNAKVSYLGTTVDYGAESTGLFCFDNQVSSLLEEELALLRGRTGANAPGVQTYPYYNRLIWNFTKGITAGEVAYAVNYNVNSDDDDADIDMVDAKAQYPQGHGDAYGHYLSALAGWYRLLRNPYFTWATSMGEMLVGDSVVNVDYFDEERFAEAAAALTKTAVDIVDRTARKTWAEGNGAAAGYLDEDRDRAFGYGDFATRGGVGALANWMVANSLLPAAQSATSSYRLTLTPDTRVTMETAPTTAAEMSVGTWTFEFQTQAVTPNGLLLDWLGADDKGVRLAVTDGSLEAVSYALTREEKYVQEPEDATSNVVVVVDGIVQTNVVHYIFYADITVTEVKTNELASANLGDFAGARLTAFTYANGALGIAVYGDAATPLASAAVDGVNLAGGTMTFGGGFAGTLGELRFWNTVRTGSELQSVRTYLSPRTSGLVASTRALVDATTCDVLADETSGKYGWTVTSPDWTETSTSGIETAFTDDGLTRIDRSSVKELSELAENVQALQRKLSQMDSGLNPLGLAQGAVPFDISPIGDGDEEKTHYEQIEARAEQAIKNAAAVLDRAQTASCRLRMIENAAADEDETLDEEEASYNSQLIEIFGYPYEADIGPSGTYPQGYDGPDLFHYMWMDTSSYGLDTTGSELSSCSIVQYNVPQWLFNSFLVNYVNEENARTVSFAVSANGVIKKQVDGSRRADGKLQTAYGNYLAAYAKVKQAMDWYERKTKIVEYEATAAEASLAVSQVKVALMEAYNAYKYFKSAVTDNAIQFALLQVQASRELLNVVDEVAEESTPDVLGAGMTVVSDPGAIVNTARAAVSSGNEAALIGAEFTLKQAQVASDNSLLYRSLMFAVDAATAAGDFSTEKTEIRDRLLTVVENQYQAYEDLWNAWNDMVNAYAEIDTLVAEGERLMAAREKVRARAVNRLTKMRYNDMYFRQVRNAALTRYSSAFDLAQKYVYLAAQAYDYETGLLSSDKDAGDAFRAEVIGARSLGVLTEDKQPMLSDGTGDAGLSDILARMNANWLVLKSRLGINNADRNTTWFSLRHELFRIDTTAAGDAAWATELQKHLVEDVRENADYRRYCQPFHASDSTKKEPAFVIPFSTSLAFEKNFFGNTVDGGDSPLNSSYFQTKIAAAGIKFVGYNERLNGYSGELALGRTPVAYLMPVGTDRMFTPGGGVDTILNYKVVDQVVPVPYAVGSTQLDDEDWQPLYDGYTGNVDLSARIRRYPSFRAMTDEDTTETLGSTRLTGRSAWNTRWLLIIPAERMLTDRDKAVNTFLFGSDENRDGTVDISPVRDIRLGLKTYSHSGN